MKDEADQIQVSHTFIPKKTLESDNLPAESESDADAQCQSEAKVGMSDSDKVMDSRNGQAIPKPQVSPHRSISTNLHPSSNHNPSSTPKQRPTKDPEASSSSSALASPFSTSSTTSSSSSSSSSFSTSACPPHLNSHSILIKNTVNSGRGLFASKPLRAGTLLEISPVLTFPAEEYSSFGRFTRLDDYTFVWKKGQDGKHEMALALGLGSLFNHHPTSPNVSYTLSHSDHSIRYTLIRDAEAGEELCISYGAGRMWWDKEDDTKEKKRERAQLDKEKREANDAAAEWRKMAGISDSEEEEEQEEDQQERGSSNSSQSAIPRLSSNEAKLQRKPQLSNETDASTENRQGQRIKSVLLPRDSSSKAAATTASRASIPRNPPLFRITSALDPAEAPLVLVNAWAIDVPPRLSNHVLQWIKVNSIALGSRSQLRLQSRSNSEKSSNSNDTDSYEEDDEDEDESDDGKAAEWDYDPDRGVKHLRTFKRSNHQDRKNPGVLTALLCLESTGPDRDTIIRLLRARDQNELDSNSYSHDEGPGSGEESQSRKPSSSSKEPNLPTSTSLDAELQRELGKGKDRIKIKPTNSLPIGYDPEPYLVSVPAGPAPSKARLMEWCSHWPVVIRHGFDPLSLAGATPGGGSSSGSSTPVNGNGNCSPSSSSSSLPTTGMNPHPFVGPSLGLVDRIADSRSWTSNRILWAKECFRHVIRLAGKAKENGQLPIAAHVTPSFNAGDDFMPSKPTSPSSSSSSSFSTSTTSNTETEVQFKSSSHPSPRTSSAKSSFDLPRSYLKSDAWDTRIKEGNPIKHAVINVIKEIAEKRAEKDRTSNVWNGFVASDAVRGDYDADPKPKNPQQSPNASCPTDPEGSDESKLDYDRHDDEVSREDSSSSPSQFQNRSTSRSSSPSSSDPKSRNRDSTEAPTSTPAPPTNSHPKDQDYLLTTLSLFVTHEPCAHCCMALVHSRVKAVYFLLPSPGSGGCCGANQVRPCIGGEDGGPYALQEERSLNHRFEVWRWVGGMKPLLDDDDVVDAESGAGRPQFKGGGGLEEKVQDENQKVVEIEMDAEESAARRKIQKALETGGVDP